MALDKLKLTADNGSTTYDYLIYPLESVDWQQKKPSMSIALPGQSYKNNILMGLSGMEASISINAYVWDDDTDRANGTAGTDFTDSTVVTLTEQISYLRDYIHDPSLTTSWTLTDVNGDRFSNLNVYLDNIRLPIYSKDERKWLSLTLELTVGESI